MTSPILNKDSYSEFQPHGMKCECLVTKIDQLQITSSSTVFLLMMLMTMNMELNKLNKSILHCSQHCNRNIEEQIQLFAHVGFQFRIYPLNGPPTRVNFPGNWYLNYMRSNSLISVVVFKMYHYSPIPVKLSCLFQLILITLTVSN